MSAEIRGIKMSQSYFSGDIDEVVQLWPNHTAHACCTGRVFKADFLICQALMQSVVGILVSTVACKCLTEHCAICNTMSLCNIYLMACLLHAYSTTAPFWNKHRHFLTKVKQVSVYSSKFMGVRKSENHSKRKWNSVW